MTRPLSFLLCIPGGKGQVQLARSTKISNSEGFYPSQFILDLFPQTPQEIMELRCRIPLGVCYIATEEGSISHNKTFPLMQ